MVIGLTDPLAPGAAHVYRNYPEDFIDYNGFTHIVRNYSAVTAACMATPKEVQRHRRRLTVRAQAIASYTLPSRAFPKAGRPRHAHAKSGGRLRSSSVSGAGVSTTIRTTTPT